MSLGDPFDLWCPSCRQGAITTDHQNDVRSLACSRCSKRYPFVGTVPCLVEDPSAWHALWRSRLSDYLLVMETRLRNLQQEAELPDLLPRTRTRMSRVVTALENQRQTVRSLLAFLTTSESLLPASASNSEGSLPILECFENVFRDWAWGGKEIESCLSLVRRVAGHVGGRMAVYGAGAGRLAVELHRAAFADATFALDINPLPLLVAEQVLSGRPLDLYEFPVAPRTDEHVAVLQHLESLERARPGFALVIADALRPPFAPGSLDAVLTPWFIDAVRADLRETASSINRFLRDGGLWIHVGPLRFNQPLSRCYTIEEALDVAAERGFELLSQEREDLPYFDSPWSGSRRTDAVFCFAARKRADAAPVQASSLSPRWVTDPEIPIPITPAMTEMRRASVFAVGVISLVDGRRSMGDLAQHLGRSWGVDPRVALNQLRAFFAKLPPY